MIEATGPLGLGDGAGNFRLQGVGVVKRQVWGQPFHLWASAASRGAERSGGESPFLHSNKVNRNKSTCSESHDGCGPSARAQAFTLLLLFYYSFITVGNPSSGL